MHPDGISRAWDQAENWVFKVRRQARTAGVDRLSVGGKSEYEDRERGNDCLLQYSLTVTYKQRTSRGENCQIREWCDTRDGYRQSGGPGLMAVGGVAHSRFQGSRRC